MLGSALLIFALRLCDVSLGTIRMIMITRGMCKWAALTGFVQVTIWVVAVSQVITHLDNVWNILGYSCWRTFSPYTHASLLPCTDGGLQTS